MPCVCIPYYHEGHHFVEWIAEIFHQCVYTNVQVASFCLGLTSIGFWLFAQLPQIIKTYMNGNVESLSSLFIITWLIGDITNLIGCLLTHQLPTQLYTAIYYCVMDVVMVTQYFYYRFRNRTQSIVLSNESDLDVEPGRRLTTKKGLIKSRSRSYFMRRDSNKKFLYSFLIIATFTGFIYGITNFASSEHSSSLVNLHGHASRKLLSVNSETMSALWSSSSLGNTAFNQQPEICDATLPLTETERIIGDVSAWVSGILYFCARLPQIYLNFKRKSVEGLSLPMFLCAILGNTTYGLSVLILGVHDVPKFMENTFPYILGSICTLCMSAVIISQFFYYSWLPVILRRMGKTSDTGNISTHEEDLSIPSAYADNSKYTGSMHDKNQVYHEQVDNEDLESDTNTVTSIDEAANVVTVVERSKHNVLTHINHGNYLQFK